ncbi:MAG TPA: PEP-CTERM sorting domain-containing protein [Pirellulales bacterium]|nr:PEP-CTERM sorting domain-containing protein [Pirellulales bacterium]
MSVGDLLLSAGSSGYVPVEITGDLTGANIASTSFEFRIATTGPTRLEFTNSLDPASDPTFTAANYVFAGNSFDQTFDLNNLGNATTTNVLNDTFIGGDATADGSNVLLTAISDKLLAFLPVTSVTSLPPVAGDIFTISLVPLANANPSGLDGNTGFADNGGVNAVYAPFTSTPGTVTIEQPSPVPEPGTFGLLLVGMTSLLWMKRKQG